MIRFFEGCMRYGAAILFLFAFAQFLIGLIPLIYTIVAETGQMASDYNYTPTSSGIPFAMQLQMLLSSVAAAAFPFFGALVIDRLDRWLALRRSEAAE